MNTIDKDTFELLNDLLSEIASTTHAWSEEMFLAFIGSVMDEREYFESILPFKNPFKTVPALERLLEASRAVHENN